MSINEVIFANTHNKEAVIKFFDSYLASYLSAEKSDQVAKIYKNIRRWRRSVSNKFCRWGDSNFIPHQSEFLNMARGLPIYTCSKYNLSQIDEREVTDKLRNRCCVLHLKGNRKGWIKRLVGSLRSNGFCIKRNRVWTKSFFVIVGNFITAC